MTKALEQLNSSPHFLVFTLAFGAFVDVDVFVGCVLYNKGLTIDDIMMLPEQLTRVNKFREVLRIYERKGSKG